MQNSEVGAKHQIAAISSFSVKIMCFRQLMINLSNETENSFDTVIFYLLFGCHTANFGPLSRGSLTNSMLITSFTYFDPYFGALSQSWVPKVWQTPSQVWTGNFQIDSNGQN